MRVEAGQLPRGKRNYLWNVSTRLNCAYIEVPKVCCTTIKSALQLEELELDLNELGSLSIHDRKQSPLLNYDQSKSAGMNSLTVFSFVRNPYTRIYSAYKDKLVDNAWEKNRRAERLGFDPDKDISFLEFLQAIESQTIKDLDVHWTPQATILGENQLDYLGRFESFANDFYIVCSALGIKNHSIKRTAHSTGTGNFILDKLAPEEVAIINHMFREDFNQFHYLTLEPNSVKRV